ncbi:hypothetical protein BDQ12DRAFT_725509 [Crucibulum laeve]|uniref:Fibronectin type-III domain-containing protein n=1 Tax=Crucibulum laeve TaxID=68775 RepID=A0A5C3LS66_9AGAR|nr:hypothetical protein BDQ12DRAFT_725509 [Crucibulum laeve]
MSPLVSALTLNTPASATSGGSLLVTWETTPGDEAFSLLLSNPNEEFALANNVNPALGSITVTLPVVPPETAFHLVATKVDDVNTIFAASADFTVSS